MGGELSGYWYVKLDSYSKTWHLSPKGRWTLCGLAPRGRDAWGFGRWGYKSSFLNVSDDPLCKRCIKSREARKK